MEDFIQSPVTVMVQAVTEYLAQYLLHIHYNVIYVHVSHHSYEIIMNQIT